MKMYGWKADDAKTWKSGGYKFKSARGGYLDDLDKTGPSASSRSFLGRSRPDMGIVDPSKIITTDTATPIVLAVDVTGSMSDWPRQIFDRLPLLYRTLAQFKPELEISFCAIGDATCDTYPLQIADFAKGVDLEKKIQAIFGEGGGGGQHHESYELFAYAMLQKVKTPKATDPFLIIFGDEGFYEFVDPGQARHYLKEDLQSPLRSMEVWDKVKQKFDVYMLHKPYDHGDLDTEIVEQWKAALGQKVVVVPDPLRIVDYAMGVIAKKWGEYADIRMSVRSRHDAATVAAMDDSLKYIDAPDMTGKSVMPPVSGSRKSRKLV